MTIYNLRFHQWVKRLIGIVTALCHCYNTKSELALPSKINQPHNIRNYIDMIDWNLVAKIAGGGFGMTVLVLAILWLVIWLIGFVIRRRAKKDID